MAKFDLKGLKYENFSDVFREVDEESTKQGRGFKDFEYAWRHQGRRPDGSRMEMKDAVAMWEAPLFIPKVINNAIQEAVEPRLVITRLMQKLPYSPGTFVDLPVMGAIDGDFRVGEEEAFPEFRVDYAGGTEISRVGKTGLAMKFTEELLRYSQFDVLTMYLRQAANALARFKEEEGFNLVYNSGTVTHDNASPADSVFGATTGRDLDGAANGSFTVDDIMEMYLQVQHNGFVPNAIIVHPLTYLIFMGDAQLRVFAQQNGRPFFEGLWAGTPANNEFVSYRGGEGETGAKERIHSAHDVDGNNANTSGVGDWSPQLDVSPLLPDYLGLNLRLIVSPFVPFDTLNNRTTILMCDLNQLGFYIEDHPVQTSEWKDPETDILKVKLKERYTFRDKDRGLGIATAKNIVVQSNKVVLPAQSTIGVNGSISVLDRSAATV